jgi:hypothetical protein
MLDGFVAGFVSALVTHPLEFLKVRRQNDLGNSLHHFKRGIVINPLTYGLHYSVYFPVYTSLKNFDITPLQSAFIAQMISSTILTPLWIARTRRMVHNTDYLTILQDLKPGRFLIRGSGTNVILSLQTGVSYGIMEYLNYHSVVDSFIAKTTSGFIFYPLDTVRTVLRTDVSSSEKEIIKKLLNNPLKMYNGLSYYLLRSVPSFMISN